MQPSEKQMMEQTENWPSWPVLPVKNRTMSDPQVPSMPRMGVMVDTDDAAIRWTVYDVNLYALPTGQPLHTWPVVARYDSVEQVIAAGWVVD